ncbi:unnamed protein product [Rotaria socialis]|uniref:CDP-diacylglycerol--glycerol-3-phosphate 3-phosphatidyltransferase n=1 Tax=Rotaria socialis TaxID=392032 RepID=A0A818MQM6_9BILA|nr:unnamed protein product [Rotaria socialis]CAF3443213.1 unnamed protein product [Rotaria socialis]CAF3482546.1 unnamed protein product [Rotaria socialis]CAF3547538.1 unnamed protein product [Rotaria socialis]CAF3593456.1 unnamed protein product [Rotaria socialis]
MNKSSSCLNKFDWISNYGPSFVIPASNFDVLYEPSDFFQELNNIFASAKKRIYISSLYFGTDPYEYKLIDSIRTALEKNPSLRLVVLLDHLRGLRIDNHADKTTSKSMFLPLIEKYPSRVDFYLFHTPLLSGLLRKLMPARINESWGVQHMKIYMADNNLIISGANLNKSYFDHRQDRYLKLVNCSHLCKFFVDIIQTMAKQSFKIEKNHEEPIFMGEHHPYQGDNSKYYLQVENDLSSLMKTYQIRYPKPKSLTSDQALVVPLIQMGLFNINNDRDFNIYLYSHLPLNSKLYLATSYFNITEEYEKELIDNKRNDTQVSLLTASPQANGFYGSRGISRFVPAGYSENEREFMERAERKFSNDGQIQMLEYYRQQWTYHAKGLWLYDNDKDNNNNNYPVLTCIGSPNFGARSIRRDLEAQLAIVTNNEELSAKFHRERIQLFQYGAIVTSDTFKQLSRGVPFWGPLFMRFFRNFF